MNDKQTLPSQAQQPRLGFWRNAVPAIVSMILTSSIVIVDGLFVGRIVGPRALAAVNLSLPLLYAMLGLCMIVAVGFSSLASIAIGAGKRDEASRLFSTSFWILLGAIAAAVLACAAAYRPLLSLLAPDEGLRSLLSEYLRFMLPGYLAMMANSFLAIFARAEGRPGAALAIGLSSNIVNVILDWLFIARLGWGLGGASLASAIAALFGVALGFVRLLSGRSAFRFARPRAVRREILGALANGASEGIGQWSVCLIVFFFNRAFQRHLGPEGLAAMTVFGYINFVESMIVTGLCIGMAPLVGISLGAGEESEARRYRNTALWASLVAATLLFLFALLFGSGIARAFTGGDAAVAGLAAAGFGIYAAAFLPGAYNMIASAYLTARCDARGSAAIALLRSLVLPLLSIAIMPALLGPTGLWLALPVAESLAFAAALPLSLRAQARGTRASGAQARGTRASGAACAGRG
jgi:putative MATE family efflux protein